MTTTRVNITIDEETLQGIDAVAFENHMSRSELITFMFDAMCELNAFDVLESKAEQLFHKLYGIDPMAEKMSPEMKIRAASRCYIVQDEDEA